MDRDANSSMEKTTNSQFKSHPLDLVMSNPTGMMILPSKIAAQNQKSLSQDQHAEIIVLVALKIMIVTYAIAESHHLLSDNRRRSQIHLKLQAALHLNNVVSTHTR